MSLPGNGGELARCAGGGARRCPRPLLCQVHAAPRRPQILKAAFLFYVFRNSIKLLVVRERRAVQVGRGGDVLGNNTFLLKEFYLSCWITEMVLTTDGGG